MPSTTNLEEEEIVDAPGNDGNASMPEQVNRPNPWREMMMMMIICVTLRTVCLCLCSVEELDESEKLIGKNVETKRSQLILRYWALVWRI